MKITVVAGIRYAEGDVYDFAADAERMQQLYDLALAENMEREEVFEEDGRRVKVAADAAEILPLLKLLVESGTCPFFAEYSGSENGFEDDDAREAAVEALLDEHGRGDEAVIYDIEEV